MNKQKQSAPRHKESPVKATDSRLDEALEESFPASDPIAVDVSEPHRTPAKATSSGGRKGH